jgi:hypothetical protein
MCASKKSLQVREIPENIKIFIVSIKKNVIFNKDCLLADL